MKSSLGRGMTRPDVLSTKSFDEERRRMSIFRRRPPEPSPAPSLPEIIRCRRVEIVDAAGLIRILLSTTSEEVPLVSLHDAGGTTRLVMGLRRDGTPYFVLWGADGTALFEAL